MIYKIKIGGDSSSYEPQLGYTSDNIQDKIKEIPRSKANVEIEKGEIVLQPLQMGGFSLHKAVGNYHSKGGVPVNLPEGSFIFSQFDKMKLNPNQIKEMDLPKVSLKPIVPSKLLTKNIDLKYHNKYLDTINNSKRNDDIANNTAQLMLEKNQDIIGRIAYLQEQKKGFPEGLPPIAQNTAPIYSDEVDTEIDQSQQYMEKGGLIKAQNGQFLQYLDERLNPAVNKGFSIQKASKLYDPFGLQHYNENLGAYTYNNQPMDLSDFKARHQDLIENQIGEPYDQFLQKLTSKDDTIRSAAARRFQNSYNERYQEATGKPYFSQDTKNNPYGIDSKFGIYTYSAPGLHKDAPQPTLPITPKPKPAPTDIAIEEPKGITQATQYKTPLTPYEKLQIVHAGTQRIPRFFPMRQHQQSVIPQLENVSVQPYLNNVDQQSFQAIREMRGLPPNLRTAAISDITGKAIDQRNSAIGNVQNQNVQLQNQQKMLTAATLNADAGQNRQFDKAYYDETQREAQNFADARLKRFNNMLDVANPIIANNQAFNLMLNAQQQYRTTEPLLDSKGKQVYRNGIPVFKGAAPFIAKPNFFGYNVLPSQNIDLSTIINSQNGQKQGNLTQQLYNEAQEFYRSKGQTPTIRDINSYVNSRMKEIQPSRKYGGSLKYRKI